MNEAKIERRIDWEKAKIQVNDKKSFERNLRQIIKQRYKRSFREGVNEGCRNILLFFIICLAIIFRPINLIIGGIILIIVLLL